MEDLSEDAGLVTEIIQGIIKAKKILKIYPPNNPIYIKTAEGLYRKIKDHLDVHGGIQLKFRQNEIIFNNEQVYNNPQKEDNLALFFFKDGVREITILQDLTRKEFEDFMSILNTDFENVALDDDIVTLLWEHDFEHIKYIVDEDALSAEEEEEREKIYQEVKDKSHTQDDLERAYQDGLKETEKLESSLVPVSESELKSIISEIQEEDTHSKIDKIIMILYELFYQTKEKPLFSELVTFAENVVVYCIKNADFRNAVSMVNSIKSIIRDSSAGEDNIKALNRIFASINSDDIIQEIGRVIDSDAQIEDSELKAFVRNLDKTSLPYFMQLMGELQSIRGRRLVMDIISVIGKLDMETLSKGLYDSRWYVVRNIICILGKIADRTAIEHLSKPLSHPDPRVRKEALKTMGGIGNQNILPHLKSALNDEDPSVRMSVARILGTLKTEAAKKILIDEKSKKDFASKDFTEKKEFYEAITHWKDQDIKEFLSAALNKKKFWGRRKNDETRACAAYAIGIIGDTDALPYLEKAQASKNKLLKTFSTAAIKQLTAT